MKKGLSVFNRKFVDLTKAEFKELLKTTDFMKYKNFPLVTQEDEKIIFFRSERKPPKQTKDAAVLLLASTQENRYNTNKYLLLCEKNIKKVTPEMNFIGGHIKEGENELTGLLREIEEELKFPDDCEMEILNKLPTIHINWSNTNVYPFLGYVELHGKESKFGIKDKYEIKRLHNINMENMMRNYWHNGVISTERTTEIGPSFFCRKIPPIWGITARLIAYFFHCLNSQLKEKEDESEGSWI